MDRPGRTGARSTRGGVEHPSIALRGADGTSAILSFDGATRALLLRGGGRVARAQERQSALLSRLPLRGGRSARRARPRHRGRRGPIQLLRRRRRRGARRRARAGGGGLGRGRHDPVRARPRPAWRRLGRAPPRDSAGVRPGRRALRRVLHARVDQPPGRAGDDAAPHRRGRAAGLQGAVCQARRDGRGRGEAGGERRLQAQPVCEAAGPQPAAADDRVGEAPAAGDLDRAARRGGLHRAARCAGRRRIRCGVRAGCSWGTGWRPGSQRARSA